MLAALLLAAALAVLYRLASRDVQAFARFKAIEDGGPRQRLLLRWAATSFAVFLLMPVAGLALLGRLDALSEVPAEFVSLTGDAPMLPPLTADVVGALIAAIVLGGSLGGLLAARRRRQGRRPAYPTDAMVPRSRGEMLAVVLLAGNAAVSEEIFFRLYLPLLLVRVGLAPLAAFALAILLFGLMHRYQGRLGMVLTGLLGLAFASAYCAGPGLGWPVLLHLLLNLNALLLRPLVARSLAPQAD